MSYDGMPVRISSFRKLMEEKETEEQGYEVFLNADHFTFGDGYSEIGKVVKEEAARFFAGEITAEKAAEYIQNRVSIYLAEQG